MIVNIILAMMVIALWLAGAFLMRGLIKSNDAEDSWWDVVFWPWVVVQAICEVVSARKFKW